MYSVIINVISRLYFRIVIQRFPDSFQSVCRNVSVIVDKSQQPFVAINPPRVGGREIRITVFGRNGQNRISQRNLQSVMRDRIIDIGKLVGGKAIGHSARIIYHLHIFFVIKFCLCVRPRRYVGKGIRKFPVDIKSRRGNVLCALKASLFVRQFALSVHSFKRILYRGRVRNFHPRRSACIRGRSRVLPAACGASGRQKYGDGQKQHQYFFQFIHKIQACHFVVTINVFMTFRLAASV